MRRRDLMILLGGAAFAWPSGARAQQKTMPVIGFLHPGSQSTTTFSLVEFEKGLDEFGYIDGKNIAFDNRWADNRYDRLPGLADDLVKRQPAIIIANAVPVAAAAKAATTSIPIVFWSGGDPVAEELVASLAHPGGNLTGVAMFNNSLGAKRLELLRELLPQAPAIGLLVNPSNPNAEGQVRDVEEAASATGVRVQIVRASTPGEIGMAFAALVDQRAGGLIVGSDVFLFSQREQLIALAAQHSIPAIYTVRAYAVQGGLISYTSSTGMLDQMGRYAGRILRGENPAELPIIRPTRFQMAINLKTAKALGLAVPQALITRADEVIE